jgi:hypothetical protein
MQRRKTLILLLKLLESQVTGIQKKVDVILPCSCRLTVEVTTDSLETTAESTSAAAISSAITTPIQPTGTTTTPG